MRTGTILLTRRINVAWGGESTVPEFLLLSPVYAQDAPVTTPAEREAALRGWVLAVLRADLLLGTVLDFTERQIDCEVFDGDHPTPDSLVFDADQHLHVDAHQSVTAENYRGRMFRKVLPLVFYGHTWNLRLSTRPEFDQESERNLPWIRLAGALLIAFLAAGFTWALARDYELILEMDGDISHNPEDVPRLIEAARQADLALGSRYVPGGRVIDWPMHRFLLSKAAAGYVRLITGMPFTDPTGGFKCFRRSAIESLDLAAVHSNGYGFQIELTHKIWRQGRRIVEIPIVFIERRHNRSKMSAGIIVEAIFTVWRLWLQNGLRRSPHKR